MKRFLGLMAVLLILTGCQRPVGLSERAVVKMICVSSEKELYSIKLIAYAVPRDEENADAAREILVAEGKGDAVQTALLDAESKMNFEAFYAQNELLFVEETTAAESLDEILDYFSQERASRPNTAVYAYQKQEEEKLIEPETAQQTIKTLEEQKNDLDQDKGLTQMIYRFDLTGEVEDFFLLPRITFEKAGPKTDALLFFRDRRMQLCLTGEEMEAAQILLGEKKEYSYLDGQDSCTVRDLGIEYTVEDGQKPHLKLLLRGEVKDLRNDADPKKIEDKIESRLTATMQKVYLRCCVENGMDPFRLSWWFLSTDAERFAPMIEKKELLSEDTLQIEVQIHLAV